MPRVISLSFYNEVFKREYSSVAMVILVILSCYDCFSGRSAWTNYKSKEVYFVNLVLLLINVRLPLIKSIKELNNDSDLCKAR